MRDMMEYEDSDGVQGFLCASQQLFVHHAAVLGICHRRGVLWKSDCCHLLEHVRALTSCPLVSYLSEHYLHQELIQTKG